MLFYYKRCKEKDMQCFINTATSCCARCIIVHAEYSLFISKDNQEISKQETYKKCLKVTKLEALLAVSKVKLLKAKNY